MRKFYRIKTDKKIFGVCNGLGEYTDTDVTLWRVGFLIGIFTPLPIILIYLILTIATESTDSLE